MWRISLRTVAKRYVSARGFQIADCIDRVDADVDLARQFSRVSIASRVHIESLQA